MSSGFTVSTQRQAAFSSCKRGAIILLCQIYGDKTATVQLANICKTAPGDANATSQEKLLQR